MRRSLLLVLLALPALAEEKLAVELPPAQSFRMETHVYRGKLSFDLYRPARASGSLPVAIFLNGIGADWIRQHPQYTGWGALATTAGLAGIAMDSDPADVRGSFDALIGYLRANAARLHLDPDRVVLYSCSANVRQGIAIAEDAASKGLRGAIIYYGVGDAASLRRDLPVFLVRAGRDQLDLNRGIDRLAARMLAENVPLTLISYAAGVHGFEVHQPGPETTAIVEQTLAFMRRVSAAPPDPRQLAMASASADAYQGRWKEATTTLRSIRAAQPKDPLVAEKLGEALVETGDDAGALREYTAAVELGTPNRGLDSYAAARIALRLGDRDLALAWVSRLKDIPPMRARILTDPAFADLRKDPRFSALIPSPAH